MYSRTCKLAHDTANKVSYRGVKQINNIVLSCEDSK